MISLPILTPQTTIFDFINEIENNVYKITNHILLIFKLHVYKSRENSTLVPWNKESKTPKKNFVQNDLRKLEQYNIKWEKTHRRIKM